ncbi:MAG: hypothetical protein U0X39_15650 [Bacteroidales bacterium]
MIDHIKAGKTFSITIDIFDFDAFHKEAGLGILSPMRTTKEKGYASMALHCLMGVFQHPDVTPTILQYPGKQHQYRAFQ